MFGGLAKAVVMGRMVVVLFCFILGLFWIVLGLFLRGREVQKVSLTVISACINHGDVPNNHQLNHSYVYIF